MKKYAIHEGNMPRLIKKMGRIQNKCKKYGCNFHFAEVGEEYRELQDENDEKYTARFVLVEAEGTATINGWDFVASIENTENGNIINRVNDIEVPERYYKGSPICEHCGNKRVKNTFLVLNTESGEYKQVGRSCLCDYTHGMSAEGVAQYTAAFEELISGETPVSGHGYKYYDVAEMMFYFSETIIHFGFVPRQKEDGSINYCTVDRAIDFYGLEHNYKFLCRSKEEVRRDYEKCDFDHKSSEAAEMVKKAMEWLNEQPETNNYMHNLKVACNLKYDTGKNFGLIASLFPAWNRDLERKEAQKKEKNSNYVGKVGERIKNIKIDSYKLVTSWETQYGTTYIYKFTDEEGNVYTWKTSNDIPENANTITGTIKNHTEYRGIKQTELTRCKIV